MCSFVCCFLWFREIISIIRILRVAEQTNTVFWSLLNCRPVCGPAKIIHSRAIKKQINKKLMSCPSTLSRSKRSRPAIIELFLKTNKNHNSKMCSPSKLRSGTPDSGALFLESARNKTVRSSENLWEQHVREKDENNCSWTCVHNAPPQSNFSIFGKLFLH